MNEFICILPKQLNFKNIAKFDEIKNKLAVGSRHKLLSACRIDIIWHSNMQFH